MRRTRLPIARLTIAVLLVMPALASAQDVTEAALKAAFLYNFVKFTEWPADAMPAADPIAMCVIGDAAVGDALERTVSGRAIAGHTVAVSRMKQGELQQGCNVLYVSGMAAGQAAQMVAGLRDKPVLTISDIEGFSEVGGIAQFFFKQGRLRFSVRLESATRARLQISSKLLALAERR